MTDEQLGEDAGIDVTTVARDDRLLDALGAGAAAPAGDEIAAMLAAWRADLVRDPARRRSSATAAGGTDGGTGSGTGAVRPPVGASTPLVDGPGGSGGRRRYGRRDRVLLAVAAALVAIAGVITISTDAGPNSPLWPITRLVFAERAQDRLAEQQVRDEITQARAALTAARYAEAEAHLAKATAIIGQVRDQDLVRRLLDEVAEVRGLLAGGSAPPVAPGQGPSGASSAAPSPSPTGEVPLPPLPLPTSILPSLPLPSLPPILPPLE